MILSSETTPEEILAYCDQFDDKRFNFIDDELVEFIPTVRYSRTKAMIGATLGSYVKEHSLGKVYMSVLHVLNGKKYMMPDVSINQPSTADYFTTPPLVAVEIRSDSQSKTAQRKKAAEYIENGVKLSILVFPGEGIEVYRSGRDVLVLSGDDVLEGEEVFPGFKVPVKELL